MRLRRLARALLLFPLAGIAGTAAADVRQSAPDALLLGWSHRIDAPPATVYEALGQLSRWWSGEHTYSGDATKITLQLESGGCFCERWSGGSVEHGRVVMALRDKALRIEGALGPLQAKAVAAVLTFALKADERATALEVTYRVNGVAASALDKDAASVDKVMTEQFARLKRYIETGKATE